MAMGLYKGKLYRVGTTYEREKRLNLVSGTKDVGFKEYIDKEGNIDNSLFIKTITEGELEDAYELWHDVIYKGERFELVNYVETLLDGEPVTIATSDAVKAKKFGFTHVDYAVFEKEIPISDIEAIIEIKEPLYQFEDTKPTKTRTIPKDEIMDYAKYIASFA